MALVIRGYASPDRIEVVALIAETLAAFGFTADVGGLESDLAGLVARGHGGYGRIWLDSSRRFTGAARSYSCRSNESPAAADFTRGAMRGRTGAGIAFLIPGASVGDSCPVRGSMSVVSSL